MGDITEQRKQYIYYLKRHRKIALFGIYVSEEPFFKNLSVTLKDEKFNQNSVVEVI